MSHQYPIYKAFKYGVRIFKFTDLQKAVCIYDEDKTREPGEVVNGLIAHTDTRYWRDFNPENLEEEELSL